MPKTDMDLTGWNKAKDAATWLVNTFGPLRSIQQEAEDAYFMNWKEAPVAEVKLTICPDPHNKVVGATRLLSATRPTFNVRRDKNDLGVDSIASRLERLANVMWTRSNAVQGISVEKEMAHSGLLYDEMYVQLVNTKDILKNIQAAAEKASAEESGYWQGELEHAQSVVERTPFLFIPLLPTSAYAIKGGTGLEAFYTRISTTVGKVFSLWGDLAQKQLLKAKTYDQVTLHTFMDRGSTYVWLDGEKEPIYAAPHELSFIPVAVYTPNGSSLYQEPEKNHMPMLYPVIKSQVWQRQNLFLTVTATNAAALMNAQFVFNQGNPEATMEIDHTVIGGMAIVPPGSSLTPMAKEIINPALAQLYGMYEGLMDESTIFNQTLGEPITGQSTFAATSLLHQAGRLPLTPISEGMSHLCSQIMSLAFRWMREDKSIQSRLEGKTGEIIEVQTDEIPKRIEFDVIVDVELPQDKLQQAQVGAVVVNTKLASREWVRSKILNIGQSDDEQRIIWREQMADEASKVIFGLVMQQMVQKMMPPQPPPGGAPPTEPGPPPGEGEGAPPGMPPQFEGMQPGGGMPGGMEAGQAGTAAPPGPPVPAGPGEMISGAGMGPGMGPEGMG